MRPDYLRAHLTSTNEVQHPPYTEYRASMMRLVTNALDAADLSQGSHRLAVMWVDVRNLDEENGEGTWLV